MLTVSPITTQTLEFIQKGSSTVKYGKITIPAGATLVPVSANGTQSSVDLSAVLIKSVPESNLQNYSTTIDKSRENYIKKNFPLSSTKLGHYEAVRAPVVSVEVKDRNSSLEYRFPMILELSADFPLYYNKSSDFCLAKADESNRNWNCVSRQLLAEDSTNKFSYPVNKDGLYTVIYNPAPAEEVAKQEDCNWVCQNKGVVVGIVLGLFVAIVAGAYVIWRISRYVGKYRAAKVKMEDFQRQISELESSSDKNFTFNANPMNDPKEREEQYKKQIEELKRQQHELNEHIKEISIRNEELVSENNRLKASSD